MTQIITLKDGGFNKQFQVHKLKALKFMQFTNEVVSMLAATDKINPDIIKQYINNNLGNGVVDKSLDAQKVQEAVNKEIADNYFGLIFDLLKSIIANVNQHQYTILDSLISCISYQNGTTPTPLSMYENNPGYVDLLINDGANLYRLMFEAIKYNYGSFFLKSANQ